MSALTELQNYIFTSKYASWVEDKQRRQTWKEAISDVKDLMHIKYAQYEVAQYIDEAYEAMTQKKLIGSQRMLQFGQKGVLSKNARAYNCTASYCDRLRFFQEYLWVLLCGEGAGFSVQKHHIAKLPNLISLDELKKRPTKKFTIPDTIEGWSDALGLVIKSYFVGEENIDWIIDYSKIRPKGSPLSSGTGKAPGPDGLRNSIQHISSLLHNLVEGETEKLRPIHAYDICMHTSDAVLSGGQRRSASISIFSLDDHEMMKAKTGNWQQENPQRGRSNNSVFLNKNTVTREQFYDIIQYSKEFGEPGFLWGDDEELLVNPCCEIGLWSYLVIDKKKYDKFMLTYKGGGYKEHPSEIGLASGWQKCNLCSINAATVKSEEDFYDRCRLAAIVGTLQAGFTDFEYLGEVSEKIVRREALLGISMTGMMESPDIVLDSAIQRKGAKIVRLTNEKIAKLININPSSRATAIKPEGTGSLVLGTSCGIHPHHATRYLKRVEANTTETPYQYFKSINPQACEKSAWSNNHTDDKMIFPIEVPAGAKTKNQIGGVELLKIVKDTQNNWVEYGKDESLCTQPWLSHNVSNTITVKDDEWGAVQKYIYDNRKYFCGISLLSESGDKDYKQAPNTKVHTAREIVREYGEPALWTSGLIELAMQGFGDLWDACKFCLNEDYRQSFFTTTSPENYDKLGDMLRFQEKMEKFAQKYFNNDVKRLTYCMKDVYNWKLYLDLQNSFKPVDYSLLVEDEDNTKVEETVACAGGACEISW